jgi:penicillin amidase
MHQDVYCTLAAEITPEMIGVLERRFSEVEAEKAREILSQWDFLMSKDTVAACLFEVTFRRLMENIFRDELGEELFQEYIKIAPFAPRAIRMIIRKGSSPWFDDVNTPEEETMEDLIARSLNETLSELKEILGADMDKWRWGKMHTLTFEHVLGKKNPLDRIFNLGPFQVGGSHLTVNKKQYSYNNPYNAAHGVSQRMIVDLSDLDRALHVLPTGESGHLKSPHYKDQIDLYLGGKYHPAWTDRRDLEKHAEATLILRPKLD